MATADFRDQHVKPNILDDSVTVHHGHSTNIKTVMSGHGIEHTPTHLK